jgi:hypothetical protein
MLYHRTVWLKSGLREPATSLSRSLPIMAEWLVAIDYGVVFIADRHSNAGAQPRRLPSAETGFRPVPDVQEHGE